MRLSACLLILVLAFSLPLSAQDSEWNVVFYAKSEGAILTLTADGIVDKLVVPEEVKEFSSGRMSLSGDHRWLAFEEGDLYGGFSGVVSIADLNAGTCCTVFDRNYELPDGLKPNSFNMLSMNPEGTQLAVQYRVCIDIECYNVQRGAALIDLATMTLTPIPEFERQFGETALYWSEAGIVLTRWQPCIEGDVCLDPLVASSQIVRDIQSSEVISTTPIVVANYSIDIGDHLPLTGEYIARYFYNPKDPSYDFLFVSAIVYSSRDMVYNEWKEAPTLIFLTTDWQGFPPDSGYFLFARWVLDGNAVLIRAQLDMDHPILLQRDGTQQTLDIPYYHDFFAGTPYGWLMYEWSDGGDPTPESSSVFHYRFEDGQLTVTEIAQFQRQEFPFSPIILESTPLGASVRQPFTTVPPPGLPVG